jgi:hypothetical protein
MIPGHFAYVDSVYLAGTGSSDSTYGFTVSQAQGGAITLNFSGKPTGVGGVFSFAGNIVFTLSDNTRLWGAVTSGGFGGFTTNLDPDELSIKQLTFEGGSLSSFYFGLDAIPVPEPTTLLAGALLLLPFGAIALSAARKRSVRDRR